MSGSMNSDKIMSKKCCGIRGFRLRRLSVQRLRVNFLYIVRVFRRLKNPYRNCLRLLRRLRRRRKNQTDSSSVDDAIMGYGYYCSSSSSFYGVRTMTHSNSFCSEAIADCLEFIKRNSVSVDDDRNPMLNHD